MRYVLYGLAGTIAGTALMYLLNTEATKLADWAKMGMGW